MTSRLTLREMIDELLDRGNLTKWEDSFLTSLSDKVDRGCLVTDHEEEKLKEIHDQRM